MRVAGGKLLRMLFLVEDLEGLGEVLGDRQEQARVGSGEILSSQRSGDVQLPPEFGGGVVAHVIVHHPRDSTHGDVDLRDGVLRIAQGVAEQLRGGGAQRCGQEHGAALGS